MEQPQPIETVIPDQPALPPGFHAAPRTPHPFAAALACARAGGDPGTVFWTDAAGAIDAAIVLTPDRPLPPDALHALAMLALHDAVATMAPPQVPLHVTPAGALIVDGAQAGQVRTEQAPGETPAWAVLGVAVAVAPLPGDPGHTPGRTSLAEEGFEAPTPAEILVQTCRHLLLWIDAWQDEGAPVLRRTLRGYAEAQPA